MAKSATTGFTPREHLYGSQAQVSGVSFRVGNSATLHIGDACRLNNAGGVVVAGAAVPLLGIVVGIVDENDINPFSLGFKNNTGATLTPDDTVITASDNLTRAHYIKVKVFIDPAGQKLYYNIASAAIALTNLGQFFDCNAASNQIDVTSASDVGNTFQLIALDPDGDGVVGAGLFRIVENQLASNVPSYNSTAIINA